MTSALQKSECCSATSAAPLSENCSATSVFACVMLLGGVGFRGVGFRTCWSELFFFSKRSFRVALVRFGSGSGKERFERFRFSVLTVPLVKGPSFSSSGFGSWESEELKKAVPLWRTRRRKSSSVPAGTADFPAAVFLAGKGPKPWQGWIAFRAAGKSVRNFPAASKFARKLFPQGISDRHSLLEFSEKNGPTVPVPVSLPGKTVSTAPS